MRCRCRIEELNYFYSLQCFFEISNRRLTLCTVCLLLLLCTFDPYFINNISNDIFCEKGGIACGYFEMCKMRRGYGYFFSSQESCVCRQQSMRSEQLFILLKYYTLPKFSQRTDFYQNEPFRNHLSSLFADVQNFGYGNLHLMLS